MKGILLKNHRIIFYGFWFLLALMQASATELITDEDYYWVFSKYLDWGYLDHPPMVALLVKWGYAIIHNELGVRLLFVLLNTLTIGLIEKLTDYKQPFLFYSIVISIGILQLGGYLAVPDFPLLFFTALFFYCYKKFLEKSSLSNALLLGLTISLLMYSKYHGVLVIFFVLISNLKILSRWQTWIAGIFALLLFMPHIYWQWEHDWISFRFHLVEKRVTHYSILSVLEYIMGQVLLAGPLIGFILLPSAVRYKSKSDAERSMKFTLLGIYIFFLILSVREKMEANWTISVLVPLIVLSHQYLLDKVNLMKAVRIIAMISFMLIVAGRIYLIVDIGPYNGVKRKFFYNREWVLDVHKKFGDTPVIFYDSYQQASQYWFYTGIPSYSIKTEGERRSNYEMWPVYDSLVGKKVIIWGPKKRKDLTDSIMTARGWFRYKTVESLPPR